MTAGGAVATPIMFEFFDWCQRALGYQPRTETSFRPDREIRRDRIECKSDMLIFDELKKNDPQLRLVALVLAGGLCILLAGLWWVQIVSAREYESHLETQSYRTVRIPAVRGKILDRNGRCWRKTGRSTTSAFISTTCASNSMPPMARRSTRVRAVQEQLIAAQEKKLGRSLTKAERRQFALTPEEREQLREQARFQVASDVVLQVSERLGQPLALNEANFDRHYETRRALPYRC